MIDTEKVIEMLQCAEYNCDNVKRVGVTFVDVVKLQIQEAIKMLEGEPITTLISDL